MRTDERSICPRPTPGTVGGLNFIQRVVALPGDRVSIEAGRVRQSCEGCDLPNSVTIPAGHVLTLGDNRSASLDGRFWGPVAKDAIVRRARLRYWPLGEIGSP